MTTATVANPLPLPAIVRPTGVTIITLLTVIEALVLIISGVSVIGVGASTGFDVFAVIGAIIGGVMLLFGLILLIVGYGLWTGRGWAWLIAVIFTVLSLLIGLVSILTLTGLGILAIAIILLYYLFRPGVRAFFKA